MDRITQVISGGARGEAHVIDSVLLAADARQVQHEELTTLNGLRLALALAHPVRLRMGDALRLEDGRLVEVVTEPEQLIELRAPDLTALARLAWWLGDRHVPVQILSNRLRVRHEPGLEAQLAGLGVRMTRIEAPFDPEGGAYRAPDTHRGHGHDHHEHDHHEHHHHGHHDDGHHHHGPGCDHPDHDHSHDHHRHGPRGR
jgi:urease accessory protein